MKIAKYYILFLTGIVVLLLISAYFSNKKNVKAEEISKNNYDNSKLIKFDHKLHVVDAEMKCQDCHIKASHSTSAKDNLNPKEKDCESCHDVKDKKQCTLCHYEGVYKKFKSSDNELIFSHKLHVKDRQCTDCHKGLDKVKFSKESAQAFPDMESCYSCHNNQTASNECAACHTNLSNLTPKSHLKTNFLNEHKSITVSGVSSKNNCMMCHSDNFCQACHSPLNYNGDNTQDDFYAPYYTREGATRIDRSDLQKLTTAHNINYKYTHGLDANQKSFECNTCHNPVTFCTACHQNGGDLITGIAPESHQQPNFVTIGANSGGGLHVELARRDIQSCQSCHDVEGQDPVCIQCHTTNGEVR